MVQIALQFVNVVIVIAAVIGAFAISFGKKPHFNGALAVVGGVLLHAIDIFINISTDKCVFGQYQSIMQAVFQLNGCLALDFGSAFHIWVAQAILLAGVTSLPITYIYLHASKNQPSQNH